MRALIVENGGSRGALAAVRSLGRAGYHVGVAAPGAGLASRSRWCRNTHVIAAPSSGSGFISSVAAAASGYDIVFPVGDAELMLLSEHRSQIAPLLPWPSHGAVMSCLDKGAMTEVAERLRIPAPRMFGLDEYPGTGEVFVKELLHGEFRTGAAVARSEAVRAADLRQVEAAAAKIEEAGGRPVLQEVVGGCLIAYCVLRDSSGTRLAQVEQVATALYPPGAGVSSRAVTEEVDDEIAAFAERLLDDVGASGVVEMQFIRDVAGTPHLIDVNPRFYGSMSLAIAAGADFPVLLARAAIGQRTQTPPARVGVRYQWLEGDLRRALAEGRGGIARDVANTMGYARGAVHSIWSRDDVSPGLWHARRLAARAYRKAMTRGRP